MKEKEKTPFKPRLQSKSIDRMFVDNRKDFYSRMRDYSRNKQQKLINLEKALTRQQCSFRPNLTKSSKSIEQLRRLEERRRLNKNRRKSRSKSSNQKSQTRNKRTRKDLLKQLELSGDSEKQYYESIKSNKSKNVIKRDGSRRKERKYQKSPKYLNKSGQYSKKTLGPEKKGYQKAHNVFDDLSDTQFQDNTMIKKVSNVEYSSKVLLM
jgi:hypothetical protein